MSGHGLQGKPSRCFVYWQELMGCVAQQEETWAPCVAKKEDYLECLHHTKELRRLKFIASHEQIKSTGLVG